MTEFEELDIVENKLRKLIEDYGGDHSDCNTVSDVIECIENDMQKYLKELHKLKFGSG